MYDYGMDDGFDVLLEIGGVVLGVGALTFLISGSPSRSGIANADGEVRIWADYRSIVAAAGIVALPLLARWIPMPMWLENGGKLVGFTALASLAATEAKNARLTHSFFDVPLPQKLLVLASPSVDSAPSGGVDLSL